MSFLIVLATHMRGILRGACVWAADPLRFCYSLNLGEPSSPRRTCPVCSARDTRVQGLQQSHRTAHGIRLYQPWPIFSHDPTKLCVDLLYISGSFRQLRSTTLPPTNMEVQKGPFQEESRLSTGVCAPTHVSWWESIFAQLLCAFLFELPPSSSICLRIFLLKIHKHPLLVLKGIYHYWTYLFSFFPGGLTKWKSFGTSHPLLLKKRTEVSEPGGAAGAERADPASASARDPGTSHDPGLTRT